MKRLLQTTLAVVFLVSLAATTPTVSASQPTTYTGRATTFCDQITASGSPGRRGGVAVPIRSRSRYPLGSLIEVIKPSRGLPMYIHSKPYRTRFRVIDVGGMPNALLDIWLPCRLEGRWRNPTVTFKVTKSGY